MVGNLRFTLTPIPHLYILRDDGMIEESVPYEGRVIVNKDPYLISLSLGHYELTDVDESVAKYDLTKGRSCDSYALSRAGVSIYPLMSMVVIISIFILLIYYYLKRRRDAL